MFRVFNMGVGFSVIVSPDSANRVKAIAEGADVSAWTLGYCVEDPEKQVRLNPAGLIGKRRAVPPRLTHRLYSFSVTYAPRFLSAKPYPHYEGPSCPAAKITHSTDCVGHERDSPSNRWGTETTRPKTTKQIAASQILKRPKTENFRNTTKRRILRKRNNQTPGALGGASPAPLQSHRLFDGLDARLDLAQL
jgi:hypothetical protein